ncbi:unnamed protein product [Malus baccata var. baccata]
MGRLSGPKEYKHLSLSKNEQRQRFQGLSLAKSHDPPAFKILSRCRPRTGMRCRVPPRNRWRSRSPRESQVRIGSGHNRKKKGHKDLEAELAAAKLRYGPCGVCGKDKGHTSAGCPYVIHIPNPLEVTLVDGRYGIVCDCCAQPGGHPARRGWTGRATLKLCTYCMVLGEHWTTDCPCVEPQQREKWRKEMREDDILGEEPKKEEFLDLEAYLRDLRMMAELKLYDA